MQFFKLLLNPFLFSLGGYKGRIGRRDFFAVQVGTAIYFLLLHGVLSIVFSDMEEAYAVFTLMALGVSCTFHLGAICGRLHDQGTSGWAILLIVALVAAAYFIPDEPKITGMAAILTLFGANLYFHSGQKEKNKWGDAPRKKNQPPPNPTNES